MRITYVTYDTAPWGGIGVVFQHLELLAEAGYDVFLTTPADNPDWYPLKVPLHRIERLDPSHIPSADIIIATSWRTVRSAVESKKGIAVHFCQGYEGDYKELYEYKAAIEEVYSLNIPRLTISRHLDRFLKERFGAETYYIGQMLNRKIFYPANSIFRQFTLSPIKILVVGPFQVDFKNIPSALKGVKFAKRKMPNQIKLIRVSQFPLSEEERAIIEPDEYHFRVPYYKMGDIYRNADIFISTSKEAEGFGLPALEAIACGLPTILSKIPSYMSFDEKQDFAIFVNPLDYNAVAVAIDEIVNNKRLREHLINRGVEVSAKFNKEDVLKRLISAFDSIIRKNKLKKTSYFWNNYHLDRKSKQVIHWWDSPIIMKHCQRLVTGDPETDIYKFLKDKFVPNTLEQGLSICSGSGEFERGVIDNRICKRIDAYEIAEERVKEGIRIAKDKGYPITFYIEDVNKASFKKGYYDIFFSWSAFHHIENLESVCENVREALKDDGLLVIQEFVGPRQFQWTDKQLEIVNRILNLLPERLRVNQMNGTIITEINRPSIDEMNRTDPSEAIRSDEIIPVIEGYFRVEMIKYFGGSIFNLLFNSIIGNFDHNNEDEATLIKLILLLEEILIECHAINNDYAVIVARKSRG